MKKEVQKDNWRTQGLEVPAERVPSISQEKYNIRNTNSPQGVRLPLSLGRLPTQQQRLGAHGEGRGDMVTRKASLHCMASGVT